MGRSPYASKYYSVVLSSLLALAFGSALQSARDLEAPVHGIPTAGGEKERDEPGTDLLSHVRSSGAESPKSVPVDTGDTVSLHSNALQFGRQRGAAGSETERKHVDRAGSQAKPPESGRRKLWTHLSMTDNKEDNGDYPLPVEPGAEVHCWNEANVVDFVLPASEVAKHFPHERQRLLSCNTTCVAKVPGRDVCARLKSGCTEPALHAAPETQLETAQNENKQLASFEKNVERRMGELDAKLTQLSLESSYHKDKLSELGYNLSHLSEERKEQLSAASGKILDSLDRKAAEMKSLLNEKSQSMMTAIFSVLSLIQSDSKTHLWILEGYAAKKANAIKNGFHRTMCEKVYIARYLISWGIYFMKSTGGVDLHLVIQLHKGTSDEFLEWPFLNELKLSIIHPESGEKQDALEKTSMAAPNKKFYVRPVQESNPGVYFGKIKFESSYLERNRYVKTDQLLLKLEMLS